LKKLDINIVWYLNETWDVIDSYTQVNERHRNKEDKVRMEKVMRELDKDTSSKRAVKPRKPKELRWE
jgi:hypothetical protein